MQKFSFDSLILLFFSFPFRSLFSKGLKQEEIMELDMILEETNWLFLLEEHSLLKFWMVKFWNDCWKIRQIRTIKKKKIIIQLQHNQNIVLDLWLFNLNSSSWTQITKSGNWPANRFSFVSTYDSVRDQFLVMTGEGESLNLFQNVNFSLFLLTFFLPTWKRCVEILFQWCLGIFFEHITMDGTHFIHNFW